MTRMRKWLIRILILAGLIAVAIILKTTLFAPQPIAVEVLEVSTGVVEATITNSRAGTVKARRRAELSPESVEVSLDLALTQNLNKGRYVYYNTWLVVDASAFPHHEGWYTLHLVNNLKVNVPGDVKVVLIQPIEERPIDPPPDRYKYRD